MFKTVNKKRETKDIIKYERENLILSQEQQGRLYALNPKRKPQTTPGISRQDLADLVGVSRTQVWKWETGKADCYLPDIQKLSKEFDNCDNAYLFGEQEEKHRSQTDIKAVTGLNADTIKALADLYKQTLDNRAFSDLARKRLITINALISSMLSDPRNSILDNMYDLISTSSRIKDIESSELYNMSGADITQAQLSDPDNAEELDKNIKACEQELHNLKVAYKLCKSDLADKLPNEIEKIELR